MPYLTLCTTTFELFVDCLIEMGPDLTGPEPEISYGHFSAVRCSLGSGPVALQKDWELSTPEPSTGWTREGESGWL